MRCTRTHLLRLLLTCLCALLFGSRADWAGADLLVHLSNLAGMSAPDPAGSAADEATMSEPEFWTEEDSPLVVAAPGILDETVAEPFALQLLVPPKHGALLLHRNGGFTYTPAADYSGTDTFSYRLQDQQGRATEGRVSLFVEPQNDPPTASPRLYVARASESLSVHAPGVLEEARDPDGDVLWASLDTPPAHGEVRLDADGGFTYVAEAGFTGIDTFTCEVSDGVEIVTSSVSISVQLPPPVTLLVDAMDDATVNSSSANGSYGTEAQLRLLNGASNFRSFVKFSVNGVGALVQRATLRLFCLDSSSDGGRFYFVANEFRRTETPWNERRISWNNAPRLAGPPRARLGAVAAGTWVEIDVTEAIRGDSVYSFGLSSLAADMARYSSREGVHPPQLEIVTIVQRQPDNHDPVAMDDVYEVTEDMPLEVFSPGLLENDVDEDGDYLYVVSRSAPAHGILVLGEDGSFVYRPDRDYEGPDSFTYSVSDIRGGMDTRTVAVTVLPEDDVPVAVPDTWSLVAPQSMYVSAPGVLANDSDADADALSAELLTDVAHGTLALAADGSFAYTPDEGYSGTDAFTYRAHDGASSSLPVLVRLEVEGATGLGKAGAVEAYPETTALDRIFPNPFGSGTWIEYRLGQSTRVEAALFDARGLRVRQLLALRQSPGSRSLYWNGLDDRGTPLPTGIYFLRLRLGDEVRTRKLVLQR